jgi:hypothetical protein
VLFRHHPDIVAKPLSLRQTAEIAPLKTARKPWKRTLPRRERAIARRHKAAPTQT